MPESQGSWWVDNITYLVENGMIARSLQGIHDHVYMGCERRSLALLRGAAFLSGLEQFRDSHGKPLELLGLLVIQGHTGPEVVDTDVAARLLPLQKDDGKHVAGEAPQQWARPVRKHDRSLSREVPLEGLQRLDQIAHVGVAEGNHRGVEGHARYG